MEFGKSLLFASFEITLKEKIKMLKTVLNHLVEAFFIVGLATKNMGNCIFSPATQTGKYCLNLKYSPLGTK